MTQTTTALTDLSIRETARLIKTRAVSPVEVTQAYLDRISQHDGAVKSYLTLLPEAALAEARAAEAEVAAGRYRGPLHGIPLAHKDLFDTAGVRTTGQSKVLEHRVPLKDATVIAKLRVAGSVLLGKLAMHEFASGGPQTSLFEQARNPWNTAHVTGGSSSGSGAAVAAGLCAGSLGSDTGGSIRGPASFCGIVGLKPTYGRVSRAGVLPLSWSLDHAGPMTRTVEDAAILLQGIAGHDPSDPASSERPVPDFVATLRADVKGLVVGVPRDYFFSQEAGLAPETAAAVEAALVLLRELGATVVDVNIPSLAYAGIANQVISQSEAFAYHRPNLRTQPQNFGDILRRRLYIGGLLASVDYVQAQRARSTVRREVAAALQRVDLLVTPTSAKPAPTFADFDPIANLFTPSLTAPFNLTGLPAVSIPCGFSPGGLPIGLQIAGRAFDEEMVLRVAYAYEQATDWHTRRPPLHPATAA